MEGQLRSEVLTCSSCYRGVKFGVWGSLPVPGVIRCYDGRSKGRILYVQCLRILDGTNGDRVTDGWFGLKNWLDGLVNQVRSQVKPRSLANHNANLELSSVLIICLVDRACLTYHIFYNFFDNSFLNASSDSKPCVFVCLFEKARVFSSSLLSFLDCASVALALAQSIFSIMTTLEYKYCKRNARVFFHVCTVVQDTCQSTFSFRKVSNWLSNFWQYLTKGGHGLCLFFFKEECPLYLKLYTTSSHLLYTSYVGMQKQI